MHEWAHIIGLKFKLQNKEFDKYNFKGFNRFKTHETLWKTIS